MVSIMRNFKLYQFSKWSIVLWSVGTVIGLLAFYFLTEVYLGFWIQSGIAYALVGILQLLGVTINVELCKGSVWRFNGCRYPATMSYGCAGFEMVAVCVALIFFYPHPQNTTDRKGIWQRKAKAMLASSGIMQGVNFLRLLIELSQSYDWSDYHPFVMIAEAFITLPVLLYMRRWFPELALPIIFRHKLDDLEVFQNLGINSIEQFLREDPFELAIILGISANIVKKWMLRAKRALESSENSEDSIDLFDVCLWYSRAKTRNAHYLKFRRNRDFNHTIEKEHYALAETSEGPAIREENLPLSLKSKEPFFSNLNPSNFRSKFI